MKKGDRDGWLSSHR